MPSAITSSESDNHSHVTRRIANASLIMMTAVLASRVLGLVRDAVIASKFGQSFNSDIYFAAFSIPDLFSFLITGGALSAVFIPIFTEKLTHGKDEEAWHIFSSLVCVMVIGVTVLVIIGEIFARPLVAIMNFGFTPYKVIQATPLTRIVLPAQLCFFVGGILMGTQYARQQFFIPALGPIIYNLGIIFGGVVLAKWFGVAGLCWGVLIGAIIGNLALQIWATIRNGMHFHFTLDLKHPDIKKVWILMLPLLLGQALPQVSIIINKMFASMLGNGPQSILNRANMIMQVPLGIFAQAIAVAIFPTLATQAALKRKDQMQSTTSLGIRAIFFLTIPSSVLMIVLSRSIIQLLLQHGQFTYIDSVDTATALSYYAIGIFAWSGQSIIARTFYAMMDTITPIIIGTIVTVVFVPMNWLFMKTMNMGYAGLALATTIAAILNMIWLAEVLRRRLRGLEGRRLIRSTLKITLSSIIAGAAAYGCRLFFDYRLHPMTTHHVKVVSGVTLLVSAAVGVAVYLIFAMIFRIEELQVAIKLMRRKVLNT